MAELGVSLALHEKDVRSRRFTLGSALVAFGQTSTLVLLAA